MDDYPYEVFNAAGVRVQYSPESCRSTRRVELDQLANGYTIRLSGRRLTKAEILKEVKGK